MLLIYYIVSEMYITKRLFDNCFFFCCCLFFVFGIPNKWYLLWLKNPWFPITLHKEHQTYRNFNIIITNAITKQIKWMKNLAQFFEQKILLHARINKKNICRIVCKRQCLKFKFSYSYFHRRILPCNGWQGVTVKLPSAILFFG